MFNIMQTMAILLLGGAIVYTNHTIELQNERIKAQNEAMSYLLTAIKANNAAISAISGIELPEDE